MPTSKEDYLAYRLRARDLYQGDLDQTDRGLHIIVPKEAHVQPCEDGAFVEAVVWVPREGMLK